MQLNLSGHQIDISPALKNYVSTKLKRLERHFDHVTNANVVLSIEKLDRRAEATVHVTGGRLFADARESTMYAAIDALADKLDRQITRHKEKKSDHHRDDKALKDLGQ